MKVFTPELWGVWCLSGIMLMAAIINARTLKVPNRLSIPATLTGWLVAIAVSCSIGVPSNGGGIFASLVSTVLGFVLLIPFYSAGWLGAGCVKMQMAYGAWVGGALSLPSAAWITAS